MRGVRMRNVLLAAALAVALAGCGGPEGVTVGEFHQMDQEEITALLKCQLDKYADEHSNKEADRYLREYVEDLLKEKDAADVTPLQEKLIEEEGISCTRSEIARYQDGQKAKLPRSRGLAPAGPTIRAGVIGVLCTKDYGLLYST
jgi:hypothetical protein